MARKLFVSYFLLLFCLLGVAQVKENKFTMRKLPAKYAVKRQSVSSLSKVKYVDLKEFLPKGYVTNGTKDYTELIQSVLNKHRNVRFPNFPLLINEKGLTVQSNSNLYFENSGSLLMKPNAVERYEMLRLHNVSNIKLINPTLIGDRKKHTGTKGEWGMGISIRGDASNIVVYNANITDCWGDGIYIGHLRQITPKNIKIFNATIDRAYRNGISMTCGDNVEIANTAITNSNFNGIKLEPSNNAAVFKKIVLRNITTFNSFGWGIAAGGLSKLIGMPGGRKFELEIINHVDDSSKTGVYFGMISVREKSKNPINGYIKIVNPTWVNNRTMGFEKRKFYQNAPDVEFQNLNNSLKKSIQKTYAKDREIRYF